MTLLGGLLGVAIVVALTAAFVIILLRVCRVFGAVDARPGMADLHEFERGDPRTVSAMNEQFHAGPNSERTRYDHA